MKKIKSFKLAALLIFIFIIKFPSSAAMAYSGNGKMTLNGTISFAVFDEYKNKFVEKDKYNCKKSIKAKVFSNNNGDFVQLYFSENNNFDKNNLRIVLSTEMIKEFTSLYAKAEKNMERRKGEIFDSKKYAEVGDLYERNDHALCFLRLATTNRGESIISFQIQYEKMGVSAKNLIFSSVLNKEELLDVIMFLVHMVSLLEGENVISIPQSN